MQVNGSHSSLILGLNLQAWLNFTVAWGDHQISHGTKHIYLTSLKRSASNVTIFNWKFWSEICLIFFFKTLKWGILCEIYTEWNHPDLDFDEIQYIGLFSPKNKLGKVKKLYSQNFSKYDPLKSEGGLRDYR